MLRPFNILSGAKSPTESNSSDNLFGGKTMGSKPVQRRKSAQSLNNFQTMLQAGIENMDRSNYIAINRQVILNEIISNNYKSDPEMFKKLAGLLLESSELKIPNAFLFLYYSVALTEWMIINKQIQNLSQTAKLALAQRHFQLYHTKNITGDFYHLTRSKTLFDEYFSDFQNDNTNNNNHLNQQNYNYLTTNSQTLSKYAGVPAPILVQYCKVLQFLGDHAAAAPILAELVLNSENDPELANYQFYAGVSYKALSNYDEANRMFFESSQSGSPQHFTNIEMMTVISRNLEQSKEFSSGTNTANGNTGNNSNIGGGSSGLIPSGVTQDVEDGGDEAYKMVYAQNILEGAISDTVEYEEWISDSTTWRSLGDKCAMHQMYSLATDFYGLSIMKDLDAFKKPVLWYRFAKSCYRCGRVSDAQLAIKQALTRSPYNKQLSNADAHWTSDQKTFEHLIHGDLASLFAKFPVQVTHEEKLLFKLQAVIKGAVERHSLKLGYSGRTEKRLRYTAKLGILLNDSHSIIVKVHPSWCGEVNKIEIYDMNHNKKRVLKLKSPFIPPKGTKTSRQYKLSLHSYKETVRINNASRPEDGLSYNGSLNYSHNNSNINSNINSNNNSNDNSYIQDNSSIEFTVNSDGAIVELPSKQHNTNNNNSSNNENIITYLVLKYTDSVTSEYIYHKIILHIDNALLLQLISKHSGNDYFDPHISNSNNASDSPYLSFTKHNLAINNQLNSNKQNINSYNNIGNISNGNTTNAMKAVPSFSCFSVDSQNDYHIIQSRKKDNAEKIDQAVRIGAQSGLDLKALITPNKATNTAVDIISKIEQNQTNLHINPHGGQYTSSFVNKTPKHQNRESFTEIDIENQQDEDDERDMFNTLENTSVSLIDAIVLIEDVALFIDLLTAASTNNDNSNNNNVATTTTAKARFPGFFQNNSTFNASYDSVDTTASVYSTTNANKTQPNNNTLNYYNLQHTNVYCTNVIKSDIHKQGYYHNGRYYLVRIANESDVTEVSIYPLNAVLDVRVDSTELLNNGAHKNMTRGNSKALLRSNSIMGMNTNTNNSTKSKPKSSPSHYNSSSNKSHVSPLKHSLHSERNNSNSHMLANSSSKSVHSGGNASTSVGVNHSENMGHNNTSITNINGNNTSSSSISIGDLKFVFIFQREYLDRYATSKQIEKKLKLLFNILEHNPLLKKMMFTNNIATTTTDSISISDGSDINTSNSNSNSNSGGNSSNEHIHMSILQNKSHNTTQQCYVNTKPLTFKGAVIILSSITHNNNNNNNNNNSGIDEVGHKHDTFDINPHTNTFTNSTITDNVTTSADGTAVINLPDSPVKVSRHKELAGLAIGLNNNSQFSTQNYNTVLGSGYELLQHKQESVVEYGEKVTTSSEKNIKSQTVSPETKQSKKNKANNKTKTPKLKKKTGSFGANMLNKQTKISNKVKPLDTNEILHVSKHQNSHVNVTLNDFLSGDVRSTVILRDILGEKSVQKSNKMSKKDDILERAQLSTLFIDDNTNESKDSNKNAHATTSVPLISPILTADSTPRKLSNTGHVMLVHTGTLTDLLLTEPTVLDAVEEVDELLRLSKDEYERSISQSLSISNDNINSNSISNNTSSGNNSNITASTEHNASNVSTKGKRTDMTINITENADGTNQPLPNENSNNTNVSKLSSGHSSTDSLRSILLKSNLQSPLLTPGGKHKVHFGADYAENTAINITANKTTDVPLIANNQADNNTNTSNNYNISAQPNTTVDKTDSEFVSDKDILSSFEDMINWINELGGDERETNIVTIPNVSDFDVSNMPVYNETQSEINNIEQENQESYENNAYQQQYHQLYYENDDIIHDGTAGLDGTAGFDGAYVNNTYDNINNSDNNSINNNDNSDTQIEYTLEEIIANIVSNIIDTAVSHATEILVEVDRLIKEEQDRIALENEREHERQKQLATVQFITNYANEIVPLFILKLCDKIVKSEVAVREAREREAQQQIAYEHKLTQVLNTVLNTTMSHIFDTEFLELLEAPIIEIQTQKTAEIEALYEQHLAEIQLKAQREQAYKNKRAQTKSLMETVAMLTQQHDAMPVPYTVNKIISIVQLQKPNDLSSVTLDTNDLNFMDNSNINSDHHLRTLTSENNALLHSNTNIQNYSIADDSSIITSSTNQITYNYNHTNAKHRDPFTPTIEGFHSTLQPVKFRPSSSYSSVNHTVMTNNLGATHNLHSHSVNTTPHTPIINNNYNSSIASYNSTSNINSNNNNDDEHIYDDFGVSASPLNINQTLHNVLANISTINSQHTTQNTTQNAIKSPLRASISPTNSHDLHTLTRPNTSPAQRKQYSTKHLNPCNTTLNTTFAYETAEELVSALSHIRPTTSNHMKSMRDLNGKPSNSGGSILGSRSAKSRPHTGHNTARPQTGDNLSTGLYNNINKPLLTNTYYSNLYNNQTATLLTHSSLLDTSSFVDSNYQNTRHRNSTTHTDVSSSLLPLHQHSTELSQHNLQDNSRTNTGNNSVNSTARGSNSDHNRPHSSNSHTNNSKPNSRPHSSTSHNHFNKNSNNSVATDAVAAMSAMPSIVTADHLQYDIRSPFYNLNKPDALSPSAVVRKRLQSAPNTPHNFTSAHNTPSHAMHKTISNNAITPHELTTQQIALNLLDIHGQQRTTITLDKYGRPHVNTGGLLDVALDMDAMFNKNNAKVGLFDAKSSKIADYHFNRDLYNKEHNVGSRSNSPNLFGGAAGLTSDSTAGNLTGNTIDNEVRRNAYGVPIDKIPFEKVKIRAKTAIKRDPHAFDDANLYSKSRPSSHIPHSHDNVNNTSFNQLFNVTVQSNNVSPSVSPKHNNYINNHNNRNNNSNSGGIASNAHLLEDSFIFGESVNSDGEIPPRSQKHNKNNTNSNKDNKIRPKSSKLHESLSTAKHYTTMSNMANSRPHTAHNITTNQTTAGDHKSSPPRTRSPTNNDTDPQSTINNLLYQESLKNFNTIGYVNVRPLPFAAYWKQKIMTYLLTFNNSIVLLKKKLSMLRRILHTDINNSVMNTSTISHPNAPKHTENSSTKMTLNELIVALVITNGSLGDIIKKVKHSGDFLTEIQLVCSVIPVASIVCLIDGADSLYGINVDEQPQHTTNTTAITAVNTGGGNTAGSASVNSKSVVPGIQQRETMQQATTNITGNNYTTDSSDIDNSNTNDNNSTLRPPNIKIDTTVLPYETKSRLSPTIVSPVKHKSRSFSVLSVDPNSSFERQNSNSVQNPSLELTAPENAPSVVSQRSALLGTPVPNINTPQRNLSTFSPHVLSRATSITLSRQGSNSGLINNNNNNNSGNNNNNVINNSMFPSISRANSVTAGGNLLNTNNSIFTTDNTAGTGGNSTAGGDHNRPQLKKQRAASVNSTYIMQYAGDILNKHSTTNSNNNTNTNNTHNNEHTHNTTSDGNGAFDTIFESNNYNNDNNSENNSITNAIDSQLYTSSNNINAYNTPKHIKRNSIHHKIVPDNTTSNSALNNAGTINTVGQNVSPKQQRSVSMFVKPNTITNNSKSDTFAFDRTSPVLNIKTNNKPFSATDTSTSTNNNNSGSSNRADDQSQSPQYTPISSNTPRHHGDNTTTATTTTASEKEGPEDMSKTIAAIYNAFNVNNTVNLHNTNSNNNTLSDTYNFSYTDGFNLEGPSVASVEDTFSPSLTNSLSNSIANFGHSHSNTNSTKLGVNTRKQSKDAGRKGSFNITSGSSLSGKQRQGSFMSTAGGGLGDRQPRRTSFRVDNRITELFEEQGSDISVAVMCRRDAIKAHREEVLLKSDKVYIREPIEKKARRFSKLAQDRQMAAALENVQFANDSFNGSFLVNEPMSQISEH